MEINLRLLYRKISGILNVISRIELRRIDQFASAKQISRGISLCEARGKGTRPLERRGVQPEQFRKRNHRPGDEIAAFG